MQAIVDYFAITGSIPSPGTFRHRENFKVTGLTTGEGERKVVGSGGGEGGREREKNSLFHSADRLTLKFPFTCYITCEQGVLNSKEEGFLGS